MAPATSPGPHLLHLSLFLNPVHGIETLLTAGRVKYAEANWAQISSNQWLLDLIKGYKLEFCATPTQQWPPKAFSPLHVQSPLIDAEVEKLVQKGAIQPVHPCPGQFLSRIFAVPKKGGALRLVLNLKPLNRFMEKRRFKMENTSILRELVKEGDWMTSLDLKDAFLSIPIHEDHKKVLRFRWRDTLYEFQCLPFGLTSAPRIFTKVMKPVMAVLRKRGIRCMIFIDDILLLSPSRAELVQITEETMLLLQHLGFLLSLEKSVLHPVQRITYLGFNLDSVHMTLSLPEVKLELLLQECSRALSQSHLSVRSLARLIGRMSAASQAILPAPLFYRGLQNLKNKAFRLHQSYDAEVTLDKPARQDMHWWMSEVRAWNGRSIRTKPPDIVLESDASLLGWGALADRTATGGLWTPAERCLHINVLEMMAGTFAVQTFSKGKQDIHVHLKMDNTTAVAYVNHLGGTRSTALAEKARQLWMWCLDRRITISAEYLPGENNVTADFQSRVLTSSAEWKLNPAKFNMLAQVLGPCRVDLFATRLNTQLREYIAWKPDPFAIAADALQVPWTGLQGYAFPPFCLIGKCLRKVEEERSTILLVAPVWPHQAWYPLLLESLVEIPILLPTAPDLLKDPFGQCHPLSHSQALRLAGWKVSGEGSLQKAFRSRLQSSLRPAGAKVPTLPTNLLGRSGSAGVCRGSWIPFQEV